MCHLLSLGLVYILTAALVWLGTPLGTLTAHLGLPGLQGCFPVVLLNAEGKIIPKGKLVIDLAGTQKHEAIFYLFPINVQNLCLEQ